MDKKPTKSQRLVTPEMLQDLPEPVRRYLTYTGVVGKPWIDTVYLKQAGRFRQGADRPWMPLSAEEYYTTDPPALVWNARFKVAGLPLLRARARPPVRISSALKRRESRWLRSASHASGA